MPKNARGGGKRSARDKYKGKRGYGGYVGANVEYPSWMCSPAEGEKAPDAPESTGRVPGLDPRYGNTFNDGDRMVSDPQPRQQLSLDDLNRGY